MMNDELDDTLEENDGLDLDLPKKIKVPLDEDHESLDELEEAEEVEEPFDDVNPI